MTYADFPSSKIKKDGNRMNEIIPAEWARNRRKKTQGRYLINDNELEEIAQKEIEKAIKMDRDLVTFEIHEDQVYKSQLKTLKRKLKSAGYKTVRYKHDFGHKWRFWFYF
ncbi:beta/alpha barrel domain-containing protein [Bacillus paralicheniformis]|uniref:type I 3-dehydroquinate dehydratase n=1 Tax=Bacillus paralicheniformis TaxID=1648923 RepID=UPI0011A582E8|nr:type I 3-dehydroquinate dehydratase [Bacillus paralicheniformis]